MSAEPVPTLAGCPRSALCIRCGRLNRGAPTALSTRRLAVRPRPRSPARPRQHGGVRSVVWVTGARCAEAGHGRQQAQGRRDLAGRGRRRPRGLELAGSLPPMPPGEDQREGGAAKTLTRTPLESRSRWTPWAGSLNWLSKSLLGSSAATTTSDRRKLRAGRRWRVASRDIPEL